MAIRISNLYSDLATSMQALASDASAVKASRKLVLAALQDGKAHYGINTGFGALADKTIASEELAQLQINLLLSHACGVGDPVPADITRLMLQLKIHALGLGYSGISEETFRQLLKFHELDIVPRVPSRGSLGASGDLAPLAHLFLPLIGRGELWDANLNRYIDAKAVMQAMGLAEIVLQPKDGLALINGTQLMSAYGAWVLEHVARLQTICDILASMSLEALQGSAAPFDARLHTVRPYRGQQLVAENVRKMLAGSEILEAHRHCGKVQDPYSLRCVPQVHGASRDALTHVINMVDIELNSVTDNPLVFENGDIISGGNFHGQPLALSLDFAAMAFAEFASISERRTYLLLEGHDGLPKLLMKDSGLNSGFMIPQYTAAALVSENKILCHPASVDSIPTSLGQEDHVSMGSISALKLLSVLKNTIQVLAVELLTASQALDFRVPLRPGRGVELAHQLVREQIQHADQDYEVRTDLETCASIIQDGGLVNAVKNRIDGLQ